MTAGEIEDVDELRGRSVSPARPARDLDPAVELTASGPGEEPARDRAAELVHDPERSSKIRRWIFIVTASQENPAAM